MTGTEALKIALAKEESSITLYNRLALEHKEISELLLSLLIEEEKHKKMIEKKIFELTR